LYASKIKETANGRGRSARRKARRTIEVVAQRSIQIDGEINEPERTAQDGEDQAQGKADKQAQEALT